MPASSQLANNSVMGMALYGKVLLAEVLERGSATGNRTALLASQFLQVVKTTSVASRHRTRKPLFMRAAKYGN